MEYNKRQLCNIANLKKLRKKRGLRIADVVRATGIAESSLYYYENGRFLPFPENYNKLAQLFGWKQITVTTEDLKTVEVEDSEVKPKTLSPVKLRPDFIVGHIYSIKARKTGKTSEKDPDRTGCDVRFSFRYEGKQGIHHMFREINGGWTRTYADYQLIGKIVKEVEYGNP